MNVMKNHPFAVEAYFNISLVVTVAVPYQELLDHIPPCLELDVFDGKWAFVAVAVVDTRSLRPKGFPRFMGNDFKLTGYRIFTTFTTPEGKRLRGLYIIRSATDKQRMRILGAMFTRYRYTVTDIMMDRLPGQVSVVSRNSGLQVLAKIIPEPCLPPGSPFKSWKEARRYAGPLPFTFSWLPEVNKVLVIEGVRQHWEPVPLEVVNFNSEIINGLHCADMVVASAFMVENIPYYWKKGAFVPWGKEK